MRLSTLNPAALLFGPLFQKDVRTAGRKPSTYLIRALYGAVLLTIVGLVFAGMESDVSHMSGVRRLQQLQTLAPLLAIVIVWFQFVALCLAAPILTGPAICDEKRARTLPALMTTPLSAAQVMLGTLASRVVQLVILSLLATPLLLAIRIFGGLDARVVLVGTCVGVSAALLGAALGLMFSVWHKRGTTAAVFALLALALAMGAPAAVEGIIYYVANETDVVRAGGQEVYRYHEGVFSTCTPMTMAYLTESAAMGGAMKDVEIPWVTVSQEVIGGRTIRTPLTVPMWVLNVGYNLLLTALVTLYSTRALRRVMLREAGEGSAEQPARRRKKAKKTPAQPGDAAATAPEGSERVRDHSREVSDRPVLWREVRQATFGSARWFRVVIVLTVLGLGVTYWAAGTNNGRFTFREMMGNEGLHAALMILGGIVIMLQPVFMTTGSIAGEREAKTWETLLTTPLTGWHVIAGKLVGALRTQWFLPAVVLLHFLVVAACGYITPLAPVLLAVIYLGPTLFFSATGQLFSLFFRRAVTAAACNLGLGLLLWLGTWIGLGLSAWFVDTGEGKLFDYCGAAFFALNPVAMAVTISETVRGSGWRWHGSYVVSGVHDHTLPPWGFALLVAGVFTFYLAGAAGAVLVAVRGFRRLSGRSS